MEACHRLSSGQISQTRYKNSLVDGSEPATNHNCEQKQVVSTSPTLEDDGFRTHITPT